MRLLEKGVPKKMFVKTLGANNEIVMWSTGISTMGYKAYVVTQDGYDHVLHGPLLQNQKKPERSQRCSGTDLFPDLPYRDQNGNP